jgi:hypothetical protein
MTVDPYRTALPCNPPGPERLLAVIEERFMPAKSLGGWVWLDAPLRQASWHGNKAAQWRAAYYGIPDHTGEPIVFTSCVFCGGTLPDPADDDWRGNGEGPE